MTESARTIRRSFTSFGWREPCWTATRAPEVGLPAHAGIAPGPVVFQDGDYFGRTVNMAARIASHAIEGQTLVSREVAERAAPQGVRFREVGPVELKGFSEPLVVYEALSPG